MTRTIGARELALRAAREGALKETGAKVVRPSRPRAAPVEAARRPPVAAPVAASGASVEKVVKKLPAGPRSRKAKKVGPAKKPRKAAKRAAKNGGGFDKNLFQKNYMVHWRAAKKLGIPVGEYIAKHAKKNRRK
jgi:septal ring-binding cell division protein DamX